MKDGLLESLVTVATAIIGVAILAVIVSKQAQTGAVIKDAGSAFSGALGTALSPITGGGFGGFSGGAGLPSLSF